MFFSCINDTRTDEHFTSTVDGAMPWFLGRLDFTNKGMPLPGPLHIDSHHVWCEKMPVLPMGRVWGIGL